MSTLQKCGPYEPGTLTLVAVEDGTEFSYCPGQVRPRLPVPGERVRMRWTTSRNEVPSGLGMVVSVQDRGGMGPECMVLWSEEPVRTERPMLLVPTVKPTGNTR